MEMKPIALLFVLAIYIPLPITGQRLVPPRSYHADEDDAHHSEIDEDEEELEANSTEAGSYVGAPCESSCHERLLHVYCNTKTGTCECEKKYPVKLGPSTGCNKPKKLGDQCYYKETCEYYDAHASCIQVHHNAICQCLPGYHSVSVNRPSKKLFCAEDLAEMTTDFSTLAGVVSGIAVLSGLICFVLKLFNQNLYSGRHRYGNARLPPPILFNSDAETSSQPIYGSFLTLRDVKGSVPMIDRRLVSRTSSQRTLSSSRRASSAPGFRGYSVSASRAGAARAAAILLLSCHANIPDTMRIGNLVTSRPSPLPALCSRRPSIASIHSTNSIRSYGLRRLEQEREQKEEREMQRRLAKLTSSPNCSGRIAPTPSPHSTDDLLPTLEEDEGKQVPLALSEESASTSFQEDVPSTSKQ